MTSKQRGFSLIEVLI
ncbi:prepilin-type N-terminal cleavage/methylation domain-containing protein, partial [Vibrio lentus]|nr:prepilin-type N-terminal cleavage/methylation domain-containing protein [Vibrio lentus]